MTTTLTKPEIDRDAIKAYKHEETVLRFMDAYDVSRREAEDIFEQMKLLLMMMAAHPEENIFTHEPLWIIDEMWHTFLMYSKDYEDFCQSFFGRMMYHQPVKRATKRKIQKDLLDKKDETEAMLRPTVKRLYEIIHDYLGPEVLVKWIHEYGQKYTIPYVNSIRKPIQ